MKLFLSGGGADSIKLDKKFVESLDLSKPLLYIPIAIDTNKHPYSGCVAWLLGTLGPLGVTEIVMWTEEDLKGKTKQDFDQFSGVYIGGGNTYKLLNELKEFGTFAILSSLAKEGVPIYGGSAGAILLTPSVVSASYLDENTVGIDDFSALNLTNNIYVWCHYAGSEDGVIREYQQKYNLSVMVALPENTGLVFNNEEIEVVGENEVSVFRGGSKKNYNHGQLIEAKE